jgi:hypothetical protein
MNKQDKAEAIEVVAAALKAIEPWLLMVILDATRAPVGDPRKAETRRKVAETLVDITEKANRR